MPILNLDTVKLTQRCAICGDTRELLLSALSLGTPSHPGMIRLPLCTCGARETLVRDIENMPNELSPRHRLAVNTLTKLLADNDQITPGLDFSEDVSGLDTIPLTEPFSVYGEELG